MVLTESRKLNFRRRLRHEQTDAERELWQLLRSRQLAHYKFRRQHSIGPFIADFCCLERRLVIELDGGQHADKIEQDKGREDFLNEKGFKVLRFWDNAVFQETEGVISHILMALEESNISPTSRIKVYGWNR